MNPQKMSDKSIFAISVPTLETEATKQFASIDLNEARDDPSRSENEKEALAETKSDSEDNEEALRCLGNFFPLLVLLHGLVRALYNKETEVIWITIGLGSLHIW